MSEVKFKVGDLVYFPIQTHKVLKLIENHYESSKECYPFMFEGDKHTILTELGTFEYGDLLPPILHATQENYELLSKLYPNVTFEPPPKRKEPREIIKAMLESGWKYVACMVSDYKDDSNYTDLITGVQDNHTYPFGGDCDWKYAIPFDPKTGKTIIDFVDGKVILESENAR